MLRMLAGDEILAQGGDAWLPELFGPRTPSGRNDRCAFLGLLCCFWSRGLRREGFFAAMMRQE